MKNIAIASLMLFSGTVFAHNLPLDSTWESDYIVGKGKFSLHVTSNEHVTIDEDHNQCFLNQVGLPAACTRMASIPTSGKLFVNPVATDRMTIVWGLENSNYEIVHNIGEFANGYLRLLKIDNEGRVIDSVRLFRN